MWSFDPFVVIISNILPSSESDDIHGRPSKALTSFETRTFYCLWILWYNRQLQSRSCGQFLRLHILRDIVVNVFFGRKSTFSEKQYFTSICHEIAIVRNTVEVKMSPNFFMVNFKDVVNMITLFSFSLLYNLWVFLS